MEKLDPILNTLATLESQLLSLKADLEITKIPNKVLEPTPARPPVKSNVAIPRKELPNATKYPFKDMKVGDSFFLPGDGAIDLINSAAQQYKRKTPDWNYTSRTVTENGTVGGRVWRTQ